MNMDTDFIGKVMDTVSNTSKLAANLSEKTKAPKQQVEQSSSENNQPHNQTVEVKVGETDQKRPMILKEKKETHIHKVFPDNRELNERECEIEKIRLTNEHELKMKELEFRIEQEQALRAERREREEYARREYERKREKEEKFNHRMGIGLGCLGLAGFGYAAYTLYTDSRRAKGHRVALGKPGSAQVNASVEVEGTVE